MYHLVIRPQLIKTLFNIILFIKTAMRDAVIIIIFGVLDFFVKSLKKRIYRIRTVLCVRPFKLAIQDDASSKNYRNKSDCTMIFKSSYFSFT